MTEKARRETILKILSKTYPRAKIILSYSSPWELLVAVILSAQCTDVTVNKVTEKLFKKYPTLGAYCRADAAEFEKDIKPTGFYRAKAKNILRAAQIVQSRFNGIVPKTMNELLTIPGVARKTANVVLGNAYGVVVGIAVDTHVLRLSQRLRLIPLNKIGGKKQVTFLTNRTGGRFQGSPSSDHNTATCHDNLHITNKSNLCGQKTFKNNVGRRGIRTSDGEETGQAPSGIIIDFIKDASPEKVEIQLMRIIPKSKWFPLTYQLIDHGRAVCKPQNPRCFSCPLAHFCPAERK